MRNASGDQHANGRLRLAELTSTSGAGVLGIGIGVITSTYLRDLGLPLLAVGLLLHAWGMTDKHRLETAAGNIRSWWATMLYWICWALLLAMAGYIVLRNL